MNDITIISLLCDYKNKSISIDNYKELKDKIKNIKTRYVIFYKEKNEYINVDFNKITNFMIEKNISLYSLLPKYRVNENLKNINFFTKDGFINIKEELFNLNIDALIIETNLIKNINFTNNFEEELILCIYNKITKYYQSSNEIVVKLKDNIKDLSSYSNYNNKNWYLNSLEYITNFLKSNKKHHIKSLAFSLYLERLYAVYAQTTISILSEKEYENFLNISSKLLNEIDDDIMNIDKCFNNIKLANECLYFICNIKNGKESYKIKNGNIFSNNILVNKSEDTKIKIVTINYKNSDIIFDCKIDSVIQNITPLKIYLNESLVTYNETKIYSDSLILGRKFYRDFTFQFKINKESIGKLHFENEFNNKINIVFEGIHSKLNNKYANSYANIENQCLKFKNNVIIIDKRYWYKTFINEIKYIFSVFKKDKKKSIKTILIRLLYFITKPYYKHKNVWLTYDKIYKSGDCGEYFYRYAITKNKYTYYIISSKSKYYNELKKQTKNIINYGGIKSKLLCFHAKKIFATDSISSSFCSVSGYMAVVNSNLINYEVNCIQHGLTMQDIAFRQNRLFDNINRNYVASKYEKMNLLKDEYGYKEEQIKITGIPRFDGLKDKSENMILLSPTWRVDIASNIAKDRKRQYSFNFKNTNYFKIFNSLINNKELIKLLKNNNYHIVFLIHPTLISNKDDYEQNDYVKIYSSSDINYEEMLNKAKLMITDYSGVQYDFAYMNKPIIYFHNELLPPSYGDGMMNYETMGFGPIVKDEKELIDAIKIMFKNNFKNSKEYEKRIKEFFKYQDQNNCKRIYEIESEDIND